MQDVIDRLKAALGDRYTVERELGAGGMATVYVAEDVKHRRKVAIKVLKPELAAVLGPERFLLEIEIAAHLQHPHILPLHDSGAADSLLYYVMPYVDGESLRDKLNRERQLGVEDAVKIAEAVAAALDYAHRHDVIHRDIKPENILLHDGQALVADFGIALAVSQAAGTRLTETGLSLGTPSYMSPEQATGEGELDARSDVYSLGCVSYEMLVGEPPHTAPTAQATIAKVVSEKPSPISETREMVPSNVDAAVQVALAKAPADRFASAAQFAEALTNPGFTLPMGSGTASVASARSPWNRLSIATTTIAVVLAALFAWAIGRPEPPTPVARFALKSPTGENLRSRLKTLALAPDGSRFAYIGEGDNQISQIWVRELDQLAATPLPGTEGDNWAVAFSPDGQRVAAIHERRIRVIALGGGPVVTLSDSAFPVITGLEWGPDDYVYLGGSEGLSRISPTGDGRLELVVPQDSAPPWPMFPDVLPNGKGALFALGTLDWTANTIAIGDFATGTVHLLVRGVAARYLPTGHLAYVTADGVLWAAPFDQDGMMLTGPATPIVEGIRLGYWGSPQIAFSDEGTLLYVSASGAIESKEIVWVTRDGRAQEVDPGWRGDFVSLALSPDDSLLAVSIRDPDGTHIWIKHLHDGRLNRLTLEGAVNTNPVWTRDGGSVTYISDGDVYVRPWDGSADRELLLDQDQDVLADLSPDGKWLAFFSVASGRRAVWVRDFPNGDNRWIVTPNGGNRPRWAHSGLELFYDNPAGDLMVAAVEPGSTFVVGEHRPLFPLGALDRDRWDVALDDQRFVFVRNPDEGLDLVWVQNFFEELKAKMGN